MAESAAELTEQPKFTLGTHVAELGEQPPSSNSNETPRLTPPEELVAKAIAPVKPEFLRPRPPRTCQNDAAVADCNDANGKPSQSSVVAKEKKSKRQLKRERRQEKKSALHLCPEIAKTGDVSSCPYNDKCRFSHDLEAFKAQVRNVTKRYRFVFCFK